MKILVIHDDASEAGGANTFRRDFSNILTSLGIEVFLFTYKPGKEKQAGRDFNYRYNDKIKYIRHISRYYFNPALFFYLKKVIKQVSPDFIHIHQNITFTNTVLLACRGSIPVVQTIHDHRIICLTGKGLTPDGNLCNRSSGISCYRASCLPLRKYTRQLFPGWINRFLMKKTVNAFLVPSNDLLNKMRNAGFHATLLRHYVDISRYSPDESCQEDNRLLFIGRMNVGKGVDVLLNTLKKILKEAPDTVLDLVGDDEEEQMFQRQARALGIQDRVVFHGIVPHERISDYYAKAGVVVLPASWIENSPLVVLEAMASGRPVVAGRIGGIPEIVIDGETGLLCTPGDSLDFEAKILTLLRDRELARQMGIRARKRIERHFSIQDHLRQYFDILKKVSGESSHDWNQFSSEHDYLRSLHSNPKRSIERS